MPNRHTAIEELFGKYETPQQFIPTKGQWINEYEIIDLLGEGSFGIVYKVQCAGKIFALKLIKLWQIAYEKERRAIIDRFVREFLIASTDSLYLVKSYDYGKIEGNPYITMQFCPGGSLAPFIGKIQTHSGFNEIAHDILMGLADLHLKGYFHRDIKPQNVLLSNQQNARLTDFGIAGHKNNRLTVCNIFGRSEQIFGTWAYLAPEQANNKIAFKSLDAVTDIYSFGIMMFELFTGELPFPPYKIESNQDLIEYMANAKAGEWKNLQLKSNLLPGKWSSVIKKCIEPDFEKKRYRSVHEIISDLGFKREIKETMQHPGNSPIGKEIGLQITYGEEMNRIYQLDHTDENRSSIALYTIGRKDPSASNTIEITELQTCYISRKHATIEKWKNPDCWVIRDGQWTKHGWQSSLNKVYVNSQQVSTAGMKIKPGDIITLGDTVLKVITI